MNRNDELKKELFEKFFSRDKKEGLDASMDLMDIYHQEIQAKRQEIQSVCQKKSQPKQLNKTGVFYPIK